MDILEYYILFFMILGVTIFLYWCISSLVKDVGERFSELEKRIEDLESKIK